MAVPSFFLYGEPVRDVGHRFLHVERLETRSRPANWTIDAHAHGALSQVLALSRGGGTMLADGAASAYYAPCVLLVPSRTVHSFAFAAGTIGHVLTLGDRYLAELVAREASLAALFETPAVLTQGSAREARQLDVVLRQLTVENAWEAPGHEAALDALLTMALVIALRALAPHGRERRVGGREAQLVAQFRQLVEARFRDRPPLVAYLRDLGVSEGQLRRACAGAARRTPLQIIQDRTILEAKRMLLYSNTTSEEIAYKLGFDDPAYFSRFFRAMVGMNARAFRDSNGQRGAADGHPGSG